MVHAVVEDNDVVQDNDGACGGGGQWWCMRWCRTMMVHVVVEDNDGACGGGGQFIHKDTARVRGFYNEISPAS